MLRYSLTGTALVLAAVLAVPAAAAPYFVAQGLTNSDSAVQCSSPGNSGNAPVTFSFGCSNPGVGSWQSNAVAGFGHLGSSSQAETHTGLSLVSKIETTAIFGDQLIFTSTDPTATTALVSPRLLLDGILGAADSGGGGNALLFVSLVLNNQRYGMRLFDNSSAGFSVETNDFHVSGTLGPATDALLTTNLIQVGLNTPIGFEISLTSGAAAGSIASAQADFGGSFKFASGPAFNLADGVTVNAGSWLVDNHFNDPLASGVPEPASWAMLVLGFAAGRRRAAQATDDARFPLATC